VRELLTSRVLSPPERARRAALWIGIALTWSTGPNGICPLHGCSWKRSGDTRGSCRQDLVTRMRIRDGGAPVRSGRHQTVCHAAKGRCADSGHAHQLLRWHRGVLGPFRPQRYWLEKRIDGIITRRSWWCRRGDRFIRRVSDLAASAVGQYGWATANPVGTAVVRVSTKRWYRCGRRT